MGEFIVRSKFSKFCELMTAPKRLRGKRKIANRNNFKVNFSFAALVEIPYRNVSFLRELQCTVISEIIGQNRNDNQELFISAEFIWE